MLYVAHRENVYNSQGKEVKKKKENKNEEKLTERLYEIRLRVTDCLCLSSNSRLARLQKVLKIESKLVFFFVLYSKNTSSRREVLFYDFFFFSFLFFSSFARLQKTYSAFRFLSFVYKVQYSPSRFRVQKPFALRSPHIDRAY